MVNNRNYSKTTPSRFSTYPAYPSRKKKAKKKGTAKKRRKRGRIYFRYRKLEDKIKALQLSCKAFDLFGCGGGI
jgi:hypothetical protein